MPHAGTTPLLAIKSKQGELEALTRSAGVNDHVRVMVELVGDFAPGGDNAKKVVAAGVEAALAGKPLWIDTTWLTSDSPFGGSSHGVLEQLDRDIEGKIDEGLHDFHGPCLIPVLRARVDQHELHPVHMLLEHQQRPVAIRAQRAAAAPDLAQEIERITTSLHLAPDDVHVLLDEGYAPEVHEHQVEALAHRIGELSGLELGSITLLAGSTPPKRDDYATHTRPRTEVLLHNAVQQYCDRELAYGDYGVVHPVPNTGKGPKFPPNPYLHYTVPGATLSVARKIPDRGRGAPPRGALARYFLRVAEELVSRREFAGAGFSWGDRVLDSCRSTPITPIGSSNKWIAVATSHHVMHLARRLDDVAA
ncbi:hypothetical protein GCM10009854_47560 [Saccharopolyspora halophila]|uniref:Beta protein n=1 Tax=Saccharopolyspora halophila TaxID=405551 RepID=A0ABP5TWA6_9PSEU